MILKAKSTIKLTITFDSITKSYSEMIIRPTEVVKFPNNDKETNITCSIFRNCTKSNSNKISKTGAINNSPKGFPKQTGQKQRNSVKH